MTLVPEHKSNCPAKAGGECTCGAWNNPLGYYWPTIQADQPTLRDQIAMAALQAILTRPEIYNHKPEIVAPTAYQYADSMLKAREE